MSLWSQSVSVRDEWNGCMSDLLGRRIALRTAGLNRRGVLEYAGFSCHFVFIVVYCALILTFKIINVGWVLLLRTHTRYVKWQMDRQLGRMAYIPPKAMASPASLSPSSSPSSSPSPSSSSSPSPSSATSPVLTGPFFTRLPAEVRRKILLFAFGGMTLHMDISLRSSPWQTPTNASEWRATYPPVNDDVSWHHAAILTKNFDGRPSPPRRRGRLLIPGQRKWRWFSCVCHRYPASGPEHLPLGRRRNFPWCRLYEPGEDLCLEGGGRCHGWSGGDWPGPCLIGITGFLYSCRQAYIEGIEVLYRTNTIHIGSAILLRRFQGILSPRVVSSVTSLELVWNSRILRFEDGFTGMPGKTKAQVQAQPSPIPLFPALRYLRLSFMTVTWPQVVDMTAENHATGLPYNEADRTKLAGQLHGYTLPAIDKLLDRIVPASTDVTISCPTWDWYGNIDLKLVETQGLEKTMPCRSEMEGLKCWRVVPREEKPVTAMDDTTAQALEEGQGPPRLREGYWVHIPIYEVTLYANVHVPSSYDQARHDLYALGPGRYGFK